MFVSGAPRPEGEEANSIVKTPHTSRALPVNDGSGGPDGRAAMQAYLRLISWTPAAARIPNYREYLGCAGHTKDAARNMFSGIFKRPLSLAGRVGAIPVAATTP